MTQDIPSRETSKHDRTAEGEAQTNRQLAYFILRLTLGVNIFLHGATRIGSGVGAFASQLAQQFEKTILPRPLVIAFAAVLPFAEAIVGLLLCLGWLTRLALVAGGLMVVALVFGTALRSQWDILTQQMVYAVIYYLLLWTLAYNRWSLDARRRRAPDT